MSFRLGLGHLLQEAFGLGAPLVSQCPQLQPFPCTKTTCFQLPPTVTGLVGATCLDHLPLFLAQFSRILGWPMLLGSDWSRAASHC